jgi:hypothetical protein
MINFLYQFAIPDTTYMESFRCIGLYSFTEKIQWPEMMNGIMDRIIQIHGGENPVCIFSSIGIEPIYNETHEASKFRTYAAAMAVCYVSMTSRTNFLDYTKSIMELSHDHLEWFRDIFLAQCEFQEKIHNRKTWPCKPTADGFRICDFHVHQAGEVCYAKDMPEV